MQCYPGPHEWDLIPSLAECSSMTDDIQMGSTVTLIAISGIAFGIGKFHKKST